MNRNPRLVSALQGLVLCLVYGLLTGYGRLLVWFFLPGIQGMLMGGVLGFTTGALMAREGGGALRFSHRLILVFGVALAFYGGQVLASALVLEASNPLFLMTAILDGHFREVMTGASVNSLTVQQGPLTPGWWVFFQGIDTLFFAVLALISLGIGLGGQRSASARWKPAAIVAGLCALVLITTVPTQTFNADLLREWELRYAGAKDYPEWRDAWVATSLKKTAVERFLEDSETVDLRVIPQVGVLRSLGLIRLGRPAEAQEELSATSAAAASHPGPIRLDLVRRISPASFLDHIALMQQELTTRHPTGELPQIDGSSAWREPSEPADLFPYESLLIR